MNTKNVVLVIVSVLALDYIIAKLQSTPKITIKENLPFNYNAQTIPPFGIRIQEEDKENEILRKHELVHWKQYRKTGAIIFHLKYGLQRIIYGYEKMPMEIEARILSGEKQECITDYTNCVRDGRANTITDANFRV